MPVAPARLVLVSEGAAGQAKQTLHCYQHSGDVRVQKVHK